MTHTLKYLALPCLLLLLSACSSPVVEDYADTTPELDLREFFDGELLVYGMLQNRGGTMTRRFTATIDADWDGDTGTLDEEFRYDDGEVQYRNWTLTYQGDGRYTGTAGDVVGTAEGRTAGSVFNWHYTLEVPWQDGTLEVNLDDWLYLIDESHLINRTRLTKFGFKVGELTLIIEKR